MLTPTGGTHEGLSHLGQHQPSAFTGQRGLREGEVSLHEGLQGSVRGVSLFEADEMMQLKGRVSSPLQRRGRQRSSRSSLLRGFTDR